MKIIPRPALVAACCLALAAPVAAIPPDAPITAPPHVTPDKSEDQATEMKAELQRAKDAVNAAKKPEDLDPVLFDLQKYQNNGYVVGLNPAANVSPSNQELLQQLVSALEFTKQWQNYLSHVGTGDTAQARNDLQALSQGNEGLGLIPRSRILALMNGPQAPAPANTASAPTPEVSDAQKIIDGINTLDDLQPSLEKLGAMSADDPLARQYDQQLMPMVEAYIDIKSGLPTSVNIDFMGGVTGAGVSVKANCLLLKFILQHYFDTYTGAPPADNETPAAYALRVMNDALAGHDWALLKKALTVHAYFYRNVADGGAPDDEAAGFDQLITGINQDAAGQYALAVTSFLNALKAGSVYLPAKFIGEQLGAIKRDHPADYDTGMTDYITPPAPQYPQGMDPAMYQRRMMMTNPAFYQMMLQRARAGMPMPPGLDPRAFPDLPPGISPSLAFPRTLAQPPSTGAPAPMTNSPPVAPSAPRTDH